MTKIKSDSWKKYPQKNRQKIFEHRIRMFVKSLVNLQKNFFLNSYWLKASNERNRMP